MSVKQISVFLENRPGTLLALTKTLADGNVDLRAMSLAETKDFGIARLIPDDMFAAANVLKEAGFVYNMMPVVVVNVADEPGGLAQVLEVFDAAGVNVEYMYAFVGSTPDRAYMIFRVQDHKAATAALREANMHVATQEEIAEL